MPPWTRENDRSLLIGCLKHGSGRFQSIVQDDTLGLRPSLELALANGGWVGGVGWGGVGWVRSGWVGLGRVGLGWIELGVGVRQHMGERVGGRVGGMEGGRLGGWVHLGFCVFRWLC